MSACHRMSEVESNFTPNHHHIPLKAQSVAGLKARRCTRRSRGVRRASITTNAAVFSFYFLSIPHAQPPPPPSPSHPHHHHRSLFPVRTPQLKSTGLPLTPSGTELSATFSPRNLQGASSGVEAMTLKRIRRQYGFENLSESPAR